MEKDEKSSEEKKRKEEKIEELMQVPSIGELTARILIDNGIDSISDLKELGLGDYIMIPRIGEKRSKQIFEEVNDDKEGKEITEEFECPMCGNLTSVEKDECEECGNEISTEGGIFLPGGRLLEDPKSTLAEYERKIMDGEDTAETWFGRGTILDNMDDKREALRSFNKVIELDPLFKQVWNAKARVSLELGKTKDAARAYKVSFNKHKGGQIPGMGGVGGVDAVPGMGGPQAELEEVEEEEEEKKREIKEVSREIKESKDVEDKISEARSSISLLRGGKIPSQDLIHMLDEAVEARNSGEKEEAIDIAEDVIEKADELVSLADIIDKVEDKLDDYPLSDKEASDFQDRLEDVYELIEEESYSDALDKAGDIADDVDKTIESMEEEKKEETLRKAREEVEKGEKLEEIDLSKEEAKERLTSRIRTLKDILKEIIATEIETTPFKKEMSEVVKNQKMGKYFEGLKKAAELVDIGETIIEIDSHISKAKNRIDDLPDEKDASDIKDEIENVLSICEEGGYERAVEKAVKLSPMLNELEKQLEGVKTDDERYQFKKTRADEKLEHLSRKDVQISALKDAIDDADDLKGKGELDDAIDKINEAVEIADKLEEISSKKEDLKENIQRAEKEDLDTPDYKDILHDVDEKTEEGEHDEALGILEEGMEDIEDEIDAAKKPQSPEEKVSGKRYAPDFTTQLGNLEDSLSDVESFQTLAEEYGIQIESGKELFEDAIKKVKEKDYKNAAMLLQKAKSKVENARKDKINELKEIIEYNLESMEDPERVDEIKENVRKAERARRRENYKKTLKLLFEAKELSETSD